MRAAPEQAKALPLTRRRRVLRWCIRVPLGLLGFAALYFLAVLILGWIVVNDDYQQADEGIEIRISSNGWHTDFVIPVETPAVDWGAFAPLEGEISTSWPYVFIGWGDHDFYVDTPTADDFSLATTLKALLLPTRTVMHLTYYDRLPQPDDTCVKLILTEAEYRRLVTYIKNSFRFDDAGEPILIEGKSYRSYDVFYHANGTYHLFDTCNNWANTALKRTGVKTAVWSPLGYAIFDHVRNR